MAVGSGSDIGVIRKANEDSYYVDEEKHIFVIADGMGGHENGKLASSLAIDVFVKQAVEMGVIVHLSQLEDLIQQANEAVYHYQEDIAGKIMGTTFTAVVVDHSNLLIVHIGDSRLYRIREGVLIQLTQDHSYLAELMRLGEVEQAALEKNSHKNVLLRALGPEAAVEAQLIKESIEAGDLLLLCTDGLYNSLSESEILEIVLAEQANLQQATDHLIAQALQKGGSDNITVVLYGHDA